MKKRLAAQDGFSIVIAVVLLTFMLSAGLASYAYVDTEQDESRVERVDESAFNLAEGVLNSQAYILSRHWPRTATRAYPTCTEAAAPTDFCPQPTTVEATFDSLDYATGSPQWEVRIDDDTGSDFYDEDDVTARPNYDANGNDKLWVRAEARYTVGADAPRKRTLVAMVRIERVPVGVQFPQRTMIAGKFQLGQSGNQVYIQTNSTATSPHPVTLRCSPVGVNQSACSDYNRSGQIQPPGSIETGYIGQSALEANAQTALKETAQANGTYYTSSCPTSFTAPVIWIETATCEISSNANSASAPGIVVMGSGKISISSNKTFYGVIYSLNTLNSTAADMIKIHAGGAIYGRIFVDGPGGVEVGSNKLNLYYEDFSNASQQLYVYGTAGVVQNSWREIANDDD